MARFSHNRNGPATGIRQNRARKKQCLTSGAGGVSLAPMKRLACILALLVSMMALVSCSMANGVVQSANRMVQSATRSVGLSR